MTRKRNALIAALVGALAVACASAPTPEPSAPAPTTSTAAPATSDAPSTESTSEQPTTSETTTSTSAPWAAPTWPQLAIAGVHGIPGLDTRTISDNAAHLHIVIPHIEGHDGLTAALDKWADDRAAQFLDAYPATDSAETPGEDDRREWLAGSWDATAVSADVLGLRLWVDWSPGASTASEIRTFWYDAKSGEVVPWTGLIEKDAQAELPTQVAAALTATASEQGDPTIVEAGQVSDAIDSGEFAIGFDHSGALVVRFDAYSLLAGSFGNPSVSFDRSTSGSWLTSFGRSARKATIKPLGSDFPPLPAPTPGSHVDCAVEHCVAITFDDGPSGSNTPRLLKILDKAKVPATFFVLGSQADAFPEIVAAEAAAGHEVASHTWNHPSLPGLGADGAADQINRTNKLLTKILGAPPTLLRPPYGATDDMVAAVAADAGMAQVLWNIDTLDWQHHDPAKTVAAVAQAGRGAIILMHDIHETTVDAVPEVIQTLQDAGFTLVTVSNLLGKVVPGQKYFGAS